MNIKYKMHGLWIVPAYCLITGTIGFYANITYSVHTEQENYILEAAIFAIALLLGKFIFRFFSRKILFYSASITVIFQIIITALELVMPDLLGALGIVLFLYPIGWYRIIIRLLVRIGSGGVLSYFLASLCPYLFIFLENKLQIELQNCTADIPAPTGFSRRIVLYLWYKKKGGTSMKWNIKKTAVAFFTAAAVSAMGSVSTFAAEPGCGRYYEDAGQDGVCDRYGEAGQREACHRPQREHCGGHHRQEKAGRKHGCRF